MKNGGNMFKQQSVYELEKHGHKLIITCNSEMPLGMLHDVLLEVKHWVVQRMVAAQKEEQENAEAQMQSNCKDE